MRRGKVVTPEAQQGKTIVTHGNNREKTLSSQQCAPERVVVENNALAIPVPPPPVAGNNTGDVVNDANRTMATALDKTLKEMKEALDKATQCSFGRACSADDVGQTEGPNAGKNLTDAESKCRYQMSDQLTLKGCGYKAFFR